MPELPEVETVCRGLALVLEGAVLARVEVRRAGLRQPVPPALAEHLEGRRIVAIRRRAKYFQWWLDDGQVALGHLGMSGRMTIYRAGAQAEAAPPPGPHDHLIFTTTQGDRVVFSDPRRFGLFTLTTADDLPTHRLLAQIGPEPLDETAFTAAGLLASLAGRTGPVKVVLLDQKVVAGIGNIYACEALFRAGIDPRRAAGSLTRPQAKRLVAALRDVLTEAIASGGSSLRDHRGVDGTMGYFQHTFAVYDKAGHPCPGCTCNLAVTEGISRIVQGGRSTFFCATRQR